MAEAIGLAASIISLFNLCIEGFEVYQTLRHQKDEIYKLKVKLSIEKCRLLVWGEIMGLARTSDHGPKIRLDECRFPHVIEQTLRLILELMSTSEKVLHQHGFRDTEKQPLLASQFNDLLAENTLAKLNPLFGNYTTTGAKTKPKSPKLIRKARWIICDAAKFEKLVNEVKTLVDSIQELTKDVYHQDAQHVVIGHRLQRIADISTLEVVADVCQKDYPIIADAASSRVDSLSSNDTVRRGILEWTLNVEDGNQVGNTDSDALTIEDLESMTLTELKHHISATTLRSRHYKLQEDLVHSTDSCGSTTNLEVINENNLKICDPKRQQVYSSAFSKFSSATTLDPYSPGDRNDTDHISYLANFVSEAKSRVKLPDRTRIDVFQQHLESMAQSETNQEYKSEQLVFEQYYRCCSSGERLAATYRLLQQLDSTQIDFVRAICDQIVYRRLVNQ